MNEKVRIKANYNIGELGLLKGKEYSIDKVHAEKFSKIKMMYMEDFMITILEKKEKKIEKKIEKKK